MRLLKLDEKFIPMAKAKVLVRTEPETLKLDDTWMHHLPDGEHAVQGATETGFYSRDGYGNTTDHFVVRKSKPWYGIIIVKSDQTRNLRFRLVGA